MTDTPTILIYATYRIQPSDVEAFRDIASRMGSAARLRDGCVFLDVTEEVGAAGTFRLIEAWRDQAALNAHLIHARFSSGIRRSRETRHHRPSGGRLFDFGQSGA